MPTLEQAREWYPEDDPTHGFAHIQRVYDLSNALSREEGARWEIVRAAVLLHDVHPGDEDREGHHLNSASFARQILEKEGWLEEDISAVEHCIRAHRYRDREVQPTTLEAKVMFDADKLDAIGAIGVMRAVAYAVQHGQELYRLPSKTFLDTGELESGEPHTPLHEFHFKLRHLAAQMHTRTGQQWAEDRHRLMVRFFQQLAAEIKGER